MPYERMIEQHFAKVDWYITHVYNSRIPEITNTKG